MAQDSLAPDRGESAWAYRLMVWEYKVHDILGLDSPDLHLATAPIEPGMTVVDWGCGPARYTSRLSSLVGENGRVIAMDVEPLALRIVEQKAVAERLANVETVLLDSYCSPLQDSSVDVVLLMHTFHGIDDRDALLAEIHRILKPSGFLFMDPGHMKLEDAIGQVEGSCRFELREQHDGDMLFAPNC